MFDPERQRSDSDSEYALGSDVSENNDDHGADQGQRRHDDPSDDRKRCTGLDPDDSGRQREVEAAKRPRRDIDWERSARCRWAEAHRRPKKKRQGQEQSAGGASRRESPQAKTSALTARRQTIMMRGSARCCVDTRRCHAGPSLAQRTITGGMASAAAHSKAAARATRASSFPLAIR